MVTDFEGRFLFAGLPEGSYQLEVRTPRVGERTMPKTTLAIVLDGDREIVVQAPP
jgi:hypothetical protein